MTTWAAKERRTLAQRIANAEAAVKGLPLPHPNIWDVLDPTKREHDTPEARKERYQQLLRVCPPQRWITHKL